MSASEELLANLNALSNEMTQLEDKIGKIFLLLCCLYSNSKFIFSEIRGSPEGDPQRRASSQYRHETKLGASTTTRRGYGQTNL